MKKLCIILMLVATNVFSQQMDIKNVQDVFTLKEIIGDKYSPYGSDVKGSAFIHSELQNISIEGNEMKGKYNAARDYMELDKEGSTVFFLPAIEYRYKVIFTDLNETYQAFEYEKFKYGFFKILNEGKNAKLLCKEKILFKPEVKPKSSFDTYKPAEFKRKKDIYYIKFKEKDLVFELSTRKSKFLNVFNDHSGAVKKFIKDEKLNIKDKNDLIKIFDYYNTL